MIPRLDIWSRATNLLREFSYLRGADLEARIAAKSSDVQDAVPQIVAAVHALRKAISPAERAPGLYLEFTGGWRDRKQHMLDEVRRGDRTDFNMGGVDALPINGGLIILEAKTVEEARTEVHDLLQEREEHSKRRGARYLPPSGYRVFNEVGMIALAVSSERLPRAVPDADITGRIQSAGSPVVHHEGRVWFSEPLPGASGASYFGGRLGASVEPLMSARHLRRIITLDLPFFKVGPCCVRTLPLIFPQTLNGGEMQYVIAGKDQIRIEKIEGHPSDTWPYENYPTEFPEVALAFSKPERCLYEHFARALPQWPGLSEPNKMLVALPPTEHNEAFGVGVWSTVDGGGANMEIWSIFDVDLNGLRVQAYNMCD